MKEWIKNGDKIALYYKNDCYTYRELIEEAVKKTYAVENDYGVLICESENPFEQLISFFNGISRRKPIYFGSRYEGAVAGRGKVLVDVFLVASTSGTTGRKKWIYKRDEQWLKSFLPHGEVFGISSTDILFVNGSLSYTANLFSTLQILNIGGSVLLTEDKNPRKWIERIETYKCTIAYLVPSKLRLLSKAISMKWNYEIAITTAGEPLQQRVLDTLYDQSPNIRIHHYYGAAEIGHISAITHEELKIRPGSVGKAFPNVEIVIKNSIVYAYSPYSYSGGTSLDTAYDYGDLDDDGYLYIKGREDTQYNVYGRKFDAAKIVNRIKNINTVEDCLLIDFRKVDIMKTIDKEVYGLFIIACCSEKNVLEVLNEFPQWQHPFKVRIVPNGIYSDTGKYDIVKIRDAMLLD